MRSRSRSQRSGWIVRAIVPWCLAAGILVSSMAGAVQSPMEVTAMLRGDDAITTGSIAPATIPRPTRLGNQPARAQTLTLTERGIRPASGIAVEVALIPVGKRISRDIVFGDEPGFLPTSPLQDGMRPVALVPALRQFQLTAKPDGATTQVGRGDVAPGSKRGATSPVSLPALAAQRPDGATPSLPRAVALASTTPAPIEPEIVAMPAGLGAPGAVASPESDGLEGAHPNYADLIEPGEMNREQRCLAEAVYFEARSEPPEGQAAVAQVVLNRVKSGLYPSSVCGVVYQNRNRYKACQFSFACEGKSLRVTEPGPWRQAVRIALDVTEGKTYLSKVGDALNYHADYVRPYWARHLKKNDTIGRHIFYSVRTSQR